MSKRPGRSKAVIGPAGKPLSADILPPADTKRWVIQRKAEVVAAVRNGFIGLDEACERYRLSVEEFLDWKRLIEAHMLPEDNATNEYSADPDAHIVVSIDTRVYPLEVIHRACHAFSDKAYLWLAPGDGATVKITLSAKTPSQDVRILKGEFGNALTDFAVRHAADRERTAFALPSSPQP